MKRRRKETVEMSESFRNIEQFHHALSNALAKCAEIGRQPTGVNLVGRIKVVERDYGTVIEIETGVR